MTLMMIAATLTALGILITIHEFGHFYVARRCGVKVLTFSIGFGPKIWSKTGKDGCVYQLAALPLGGYVRMLDSREGQVDASLVDQAFDKKPLGQRAAVVAAGPAINLIFAALVYAVLAMAGTQYAAPIVGAVTPGSAAEQSGLPAGNEILTVDGASTDGWQAVALGILSQAGEREPVILTSSRPGESIVQTHALDVSGLSGQLDDPLNQLGIQPFSPDIPAIVGELAPGAPAERAGLLPGDQIISINQQPISDWMVLVESVQASDGRPQDWVIVRDGAEQSLVLAPEMIDGSLRVGILPQPIELPDEFVRFKQAGPIEGLVEGVARTYQMSVITLEAMWKMVTGVLSTANLSGPITIAKVATTSAESGLLPYLAFIAYLSVSLGVLNLLPVPVLDGGHLAWYAIEAVRGKPVSERIQAMGMQVGMSLVLLLMFVAFYNDLFRP